MVGVLGKKVLGCGKEVWRRCWCWEADSAAEVGQIGWRMLGDAAEK